MSSRWERLLDLKRLTLADALMNEAAKRLAEELLGSFPPPVEALDLSTGGEFAPLFEEGVKRPPVAAFVEAVRMARWDLSRDFDAFDEYVRNRRFEERGVAAEHRLALLFLARWLVEEMLSLGDATEGRIKRKDMIAGLDRLEKLLLPA